MPRHRNFGDEPHSADIEPAADDNRLTAGDVNRDVADERPEFVNQS